MAIPTVVCNEQTHRAQILGVLEFRFDADIVHAGVQNATQVPHDVLLGVQEDGLGRIRVVVAGRGREVQDLGDAGRLLDHNVAILVVAVTVVSRVGGGERRRCRVDVVFVSRRR
jgi:hypothetical protein